MQLSGVSGCLGTSPNHCCIGDIARLETLRSCDRDRRAFSSHLLSPRRSHTELRSARATLAPCSSHTWKLEQLPSACLCFSNSTPCFGHEHVQSVPRQTGLELSEHTYSDSIRCGTPCSTNSSRHQTWFGGKTSQMVFHHHIGCNVSSVSYCVPYHGFTVQHNVERGRKWNGDCNE